MFDFLDTLRKKDTHARIRIAFITALVITVIIAIGWAFSISARFATMADNITASKKEDESSERAVKSIEDVVKSAELFRRTPPESGGEDEELAAPAPAAVTDVAIPRRVLIATTTGEKSE